MQKHQLTVVTLVHGVNEVCHGSSFVFKDIVYISSAIDYILRRSCD